ncbi:hypothetical protein OLZ32_24495 [Rhizobium sp. 1AS11]|uniref:hypothetical protein n=1 Tax=Rhizobium acaciae TaxID=2989736 RepID=UPI002222E180|nr:hypothetical protein [Rhizobium acaciae]MCW1411435.1 hypothetical protein [Rhizobium acaciae]MCW1743533.1 hypothetical protein [Rhizobium acaciae]
MGGHRQYSHRDAEKVPDRDLKEVRLTAAVFFEARGKPHESRRISEAEAEITATEEEDFEELYGAWEPTLYAAAMADDRYFALLIGGPRWDDPYTIILTRDAEAQTFSRLDVRRELRDVRVVPRTDDVGILCDAQPERRHLCDQSQRRGAFGHSRDPGRIR